jgi:glycine oxidase
MKHLLVIGAGVMGLGVAWRAAARGMRVTILDANEPGRAASWAAGGMLAPHAELEFDEYELQSLGERSQSLWPDFVAELEEASGQLVGYDRTGTILVSVDRDEAEALRRICDYQLERGLNVHWLSGDACRELEPLLSPYVHSGIQCPDDHNVDNRQLLVALQQAAILAGAELRSGTRVAHVEASAGAVTGVVLEGGEQIAADAVLVAAGAWSRGINGLSPSPPVRPVKGQMVAFGLDAPSSAESHRAVSHAPSPPIRHVVRSTEVYLVPKADRIVVGATSEERGFDATVTAGGVFELLRRAYDVLPIMYELPLFEPWVGFRPGSRDNGPMLGAAAVEGLHYITGHYRNGIQLAPISVDAVVAGLFGEEVSEVARPFTPTRFS